MLAIGCVKCRKEFKVSGADFDDRKKNGVPDLCNICVSDDMEAIDQPILAETESPETVSFPGYYDPKPVDAIDLVKEKTEIEK